jgi:tellurium resistance protein TerD
MSINLQKGQVIDLEKSQYDLSQVTIGLGWNVRKRNTGFLGALLGNSDDADYDLDAVAFLLNAQDKVATGTQLAGGDVVFYNSPRHPSGTIWLTGDNRTGSRDGDDDEQIVVHLDAMPAAYQKIVFIVQIYEGIKHNQHFGMVDNAFIRAVDARGKEMLRFNVSGDAAYRDKRSVVFAEVYRRDGGWRFRAIGSPHPTDTFIDILRPYIN